VAVSGLLAGPVQGVPDDDIPETETPLRNRQASALRIGRLKSREQDKAMKLDIVVPTHNRSALLRNTIASLLRAPVPEETDVTLLIVDNNSKDDTECVVRGIQSKTRIQCVYVKETNQGLSHARNAGIRAGTGDLVGFIDDDEEIDENWYKVVALEFADSATQFICGPYKADRKFSVPAWFPPIAKYQGVIGVNVPMPRYSFGEAYQGNLMGGNAVIRRSVFELIGMFSTNLGRTAKGLLAGEDSELTSRMLKAGLQGIYVPELVIYHHIPAYRLTRRYFRRHTFWGGVSKGVSARDAIESVPCVFGIPRYRIGRMVRALASLPRHLFVIRDLGLVFDDELLCWYLLGYIYGRHFIRIEKHCNRQ
jgi:glucosyl-dolichyl phosphate glucuronosyltransferase